MKILTLPPLELLQERYYISDDSPSGLRNKKCLGPRAPKDAVAGWLRNDGKYSLKCNDRVYYAHRIAYYLMTGENPVDNMIDHTNGKKDALTLRIATQQQNSCNITTGKGHRGVYWYKANKKWRARIGYYYKRIFLGDFINFDDAARAYNKAALELHGEFATLISL